MFEHLENISEDLSCNGSLAHEISGLGLRFRRFKAQHVPRICNRVVDSLAHLVKFVGINVWRNLSFE